MKQPERLNGEIQEEKEEVRYVPQSLQLLTKEKLDEMLAEGEAVEVVNGKVLTIIAAVAGG